MTFDPPGAPHNPNPRMSYDSPLSPGQVAWVTELSMHVADSSAAGIAKGFVRLGVAHRLLCLAHLAVLADHQGPEETEAWLIDQLRRYYVRSGEVRRDGASDTARADAFEAAEGVTLRRGGRL